MPAESWKDCLANGIQDKPFAPRQELRSLSNEQRYLLIEGLARFQHVPMMDPISYFQITGIHGYPFKKYPCFADDTKDWNTPFPESKGNTAAGGFQGFCTHTSILFLPWHRPYIALFESNLYKHVNEIAKGIPSNDRNKETYMQLAASFRWPYWDWARRDVPSVFPFEAAINDYTAVFKEGFDVQTLPKSSESVFEKGNLIVPEGVEKYNPLHHAPFEKDEKWPEVFKKGSDPDLPGIKWFNPKEYKRFDEPKNYVDRTVRYPQLDDSENKLMQAFRGFYSDPSWRPESNKRDLMNPFRNLTERVAYLLLSYKDYPAMSHNRYNPKWKDDYYKPYDPNAPPPTLDPPMGAQTVQAEIWASMEGIHNTCHNACGGTYSVGDENIPDPDNPGKEKPNPDFEDWSGHMSGITKSAFDPIFWLHHTNIDRLWAIWQALHDGREDPKLHQTWVTEQTAGAGNWFSHGELRTEDNTLIRLGDKESAQTPLLPFKYWEGQDDWYLCDQTKMPEAFNYTYPEVEGLTSFPISDAAAAKLTETINKLYPNPASLIQQSQANEGNTGVEDNAGEILLKQVAALKKIRAGEIRPTWAELEQTDLIKDDFDFDRLLKESTEAKERIRNITFNNKYLEWLVNIKGERHALDGNYQVGIFLDKFEESDPVLWPLSPNYVGTFSPLGQRPDTQCGRCKDQQDDKVEVTGQIPLTIALIERYLAGFFEKFDEKTITAYLTDKLHWRVTAAGQLLDDQSAVDGLKVFVVTNEVTLPADGTGLPQYAPDVRVHASITEGRGHGTGLTRDQVTTSATVALAQ